MDEHGREIVFLISQPRSGSTLLQHILASHEAVHTLPEPWIMLHLVFGLRQSELQAPYNAQIASRALQEYLGRLPGGEESYASGVRRLALGLYREALSAAGKRIFLDKTPRYYFITKELARIFPEARFVILIRNPLAVLASIMETNFGGDFRGLFRGDRKHDLLAAPRMILDGIDLLGERAIVVRYEDLVSEPVPVVGSLCERLGLTFDEAMIEYGRGPRFQETNFVDPKSIYRHSRPTTSYLDHWTRALDTPQKVHIARSYLESLGRETVGAQGYDFEELKEKLQHLKCRTLLPLAPWRLLAREPDSLHWWQRKWLAITRLLQVGRHSLRVRGLRGALRAGCRKLVDSKR